MPSDKHELAQRLALAKPTFSTRGVFFNCILKLVEQHAGVPGLLQVKVGNLRNKLSDFRSYPIVDFLNLLYTTADVLQETLGNQHAVFHACGAVSVNTFAKSAAGAVIFGILGKGNPTKLLSATDKAYQTVVNYGQRDFAITGEKSVALTFRDDMMPPAYHAGIFKTALDSMGFRATVVTRPHGFNGCEYRCSWE